MRWLGRGVHELAGEPQEQDPLPLGCPSPGARAQTSPAPGREGTDCSYCNGEFRLGSRH